MNRVEPIHFGPGGSLFGLRSAPAGVARSTAVLLCQAWGPEYMRSYRAMHLLSGLLAQKGFETLRFDYSATGDSADHAPASVPQWIEDIGCSLRELREWSGASQICVLGLRLGALLALRARELGLHFEHLALWDAPASGEAWLQQLTELDRQHYENKNRYLPEALRLRQVDDELLGAPWPAALSAEVAALGPVPAAADDTLQLHSADEPVPAGAHPTLSLPDPAHWTEISWLTTPWNPSGSPRAICDLLASRMP